MIEKKVETCKESFRNRGGVKRRKTNMLKTRGALDEIWGRSKKG